MMPYKTFKLRFEECEHVFSVPLHAFIASELGGKREGDDHAKPRGYAKVVPLVTGEVTPNSVTVAPE